MSIEKKISNLIDIVSNPDNLKFVSNARRYSFVFGKTWGIFSSSILNTPRSQLALDKIQKLLDIQKNVQAKKNEIDNNNNLLREIKFVRKFNVKQDLDAE